MAFHFVCKNCGYEQEAHDPNLVNEPAEGDYAGIETPAEGYPMSILECLETEWSHEYRACVANLYWGKDNSRGYGYVSPDPEAEVAEYRAHPVGMQTSVMVVYDSRIGGSFVVPLD